MLDVYILINERGVFTMVCDKCGAEVSREDRFCPECGVELLKKKKKKKEKDDIPEVQEYKLKDNEVEKLSKYFANPEEKYISSLGNGYIMNFLTSKSARKGFAFLINKRVYFIGSCLSGTGKNLVKTDEERTVDVKNITGSGFVYWRYWGRLIALLGALIALVVGELWFAEDILNLSNVLWDILYFLKSLPYISYYEQVDLRWLKEFILILLSVCLSVPFMVILCIGIKNYLLKRKTLFRIEYAGGCIAFDVSFYAKAEIEDFQRQLRRVKDFAEETAVMKTFDVEKPV